MTKTGGGSGRRSHGTKLFVFPDEGRSYVANLLQMLDTIGNAQSSAEKLQMMEELEQTLSRLVDEERGKARRSQIPPQPPQAPPPMGALDEDEFQQAIRALENLRLRLADEEESLLQAETALRQSRDEEATLRLAEEALQRERARAERRKEETLRKTQVFLESAKDARRKAKELKQQTPQPQRAAAPPKKSFRPTIALDSFFSSGGVANNRNRPNVDNSQLPPGYPAPSAPEGVPTLGNWKLNPDGTVTGNIIGSNMFREGAIVTTSILATRAEIGTVASTSSGSQ